MEATNIQKIDRLKELYYSKGEYSYYGLMYCANCKMITSNKLYENPYSDEDEYICNNCHCDIYTEGTVHLSDIVEDESYLDHFIPENILDMFIEYIERKNKELI